MTKDKWANAHHGKDKKNVSNKVTRFPIQKSVEKEYSLDELDEMLQDMFDDIIGENGISLSYDDFQTGLAMQFVAELAGDVTEDICTNFLVRNTGKLKDAVLSGNANLRKYIEEEFAYTIEEIDSFIRDCGGEREVAKDAKQYIEKSRNKATFADNILTIISETLEKDFKELDQAAEYSTAKGLSKEFTMLESGVATNIIHEIYHGHFAEELNDDMELACGCTIGKTDYLKYGFQFCPLCGEKIEL